MSYIHDLFNRIKAYPIPEDVQDRFSRCTKDHYPAEVIDRVRKDGTDPLIIGYEHSETVTPLVLKTVGSLYSTSGDALRTVAHEIAPEGLGWIVDYLADKKEFDERSTVKNGEVTTPEYATALHEYRRVLLRSQSSTLALKMLENGLQVKPLEHHDIHRWIREDEARNLVEGDGFLGSRWSELRPAYTAIRRDAHALAVIDAIRPDLITCGFYHALKLDLLLDRDGTRTFLIAFDAPPLDSIMEMWEEVHKLRGLHS